MCERSVVVKQVLAAVRKQACTNVSAETLYERLCVNSRVCVWYHKFKKKSSKFVICNSMDVGYADWVTGRQNPIWRVQYRYM